MSPEDRQALIRSHFEAVRDIIWAQDLEPKFKVEGVDAARMKGFRDAWNQFAEARDWAWWQKESARCSDERLQDMMMDTVERGDALGLMQYRRLLADASNRPAAKDKEKGVDR